MKKLPVALSLLTIMIAGCGGGGGDERGSIDPNQNAPGRAAVSGTVYSPSSVSGARSLMRSAKAVSVGKDKRVSGASVSVHRMKSDGTLEAVSDAQSVTTDQQGNYTLNNVPEGNLVLAAVKEGTDGENLSLTSMVSVNEEDAVTGSVSGVETDVVSTLTVESIKDVLSTVNSGRAESEKLDASDLPGEEVENIRTVINEALYRDSLGGQTVDLNGIATGGATGASAQLTNLENSPEGAGVRNKKTSIATKGSIRVHVVAIAGGGGPLQDATVTLTIDGDAMVVQTDYRGNAFFGDIDVGSNIEVEVVKTGYKMVRTSHNLESAAVVNNVTVQMEQSSTDQAPVAKAGEDMENQHSVVQLDGSKSFDPEGMSLTYSWTLQGTGGTLSGASTASPTFTPAGAGTFTITLVVSDGSLFSDPDSMIITVAATHCSSDPDCSDGIEYTTDTCINPGMASATCMNVDDTGPYVIEFIPADGATGVLFNKTTFSVVFNEPMDASIDYNDQTILTEGGFSNTIKKLDTGTLISINHRTALMAGTFIWRKTYVTNDTLSFTLNDNSIFAAFRAPYLKPGHEYEITKRVVPVNLTDAAGNSLDTTRNIQETGRFTTIPCVTDLDCTDYNSETEDTCSGAGTSEAVCTNL